MSSEEAISDQLEKQKIKRNKDVRQLYLSHMKLSESPDLTKYKFLTILWLNGNELRNVNSLAPLENLSELYLHDNFLRSITGALSSLRKLTTLTLQNNQLDSLTSTLEELRTMAFLSCLNLFANPIAQNTNYRLQTIFTIPSLQILDQLTVKNDERRRSRQLFDIYREPVRRQVAFLRTSRDLEPIERPTSSFFRLTQPLDCGNNFLKKSQVFASDLEAARARARHHSLMSWSHLDWSTVAARAKGQQQSAEPQIITISFQ